MDKLTILSFLAAIQFCGGQIEPATQVTINIEDDSVESEHTFTFKSTKDSVGTAENNYFAPPTLFPIDITFTGGECYRPLLDIEAERIDGLNRDDEYLKFFQRQFKLQFPYLLSFCGNLDDLERLMNSTKRFATDCGNYTTCATDIDLTADLGVTQRSIDSLALFILKSADLADTESSRCDNYTVNVNFTITCQAVPDLEDLLECDLCDSLDPSSEDSGDSAQSAFQQENAIINDQYEGQDEGDQDYKGHDREYNVNVIVPQGMFVYLVCIISVCLVSICCVGLLYQKYKVRY